MPHAIPVVCSGCADTDLPWWQVGPLAVLGCLLAYGLLWGLVKLLELGRGRRGHRPPTATGQPPTVPGPPPLAPGRPPAVGPLRTVAVNREQRYALAVHDATGRCYVTIPVANRLADYEEEYEVDRGTFERFRIDPVAALAFVTRCRNRELDHLLRLQPGRDRGVPS